MTTRIIYHMDSDGKASAAVVAHFLRQKGVRDICFVPINYGMELNTRDWNLQDDQVYLVDFSFQPVPKMLQFVDSVKHLTWIDHHATSVEMDEHEVDLQRVPGLRESGLAGCELCWRYFSAEEPPKAITLIGEWDTWRRGANWETEVRPFQSFLYLNDDRPQSEEFWEGLIAATDVSAWLGLGRIAGMVKDRMDDAVIGATSFVAKFAGYKAVIANGSGNSTMFERNYNLSGFDLMVLFQLKQGKYVSLSIYGVNDKIDCGQLAKKLGEAGPMPSGGGHAKAAGFQCSWDYLMGLITDIEEGKQWRISSPRRSISDLALR